LFQHPLLSTADIPTSRWVPNLMLWFGCGRQQKRHTATPSPTGVRRRTERNRLKLVGRDKGSLTEQQSKETGTSTIQKRGIHKTNQQNRACRTESLSRTGPAPHAPEPQESSHHSTPPQRNPAWRHMVWNSLLCLARSGQSARLCPFLDSSEN